MKHTFQIPPIMQHLPLDERGYPIPYFVSIVDGKPEFRYQDGRKREAMINHNLCFICGKKLHDKSYWFLTGPAGLLNQVGSDAPMHEDCARFSLSACPHMVYQNAERRENGAPIEKAAGLIREKPPVMYLIKADKVDVERYREGKQESVYFRYRTLKDKTEKYAYHNGVLTRILYEYDDKKLIIPMTLYGTLADEEFVTLEGLKYAVITPRDPMAGEIKFALVRLHDKKVFAQRDITVEGVNFIQLN